MRHERVEEADPEIGDETNGDRSGDLRPEHRADAARERECETIDDERHETDGDGYALAALQRPPDDRAHDDDLDRRAETHCDPDVARRAAERRCEHDRKR